MARLTIKAVPSLLVADLEATLAFYGKLGFTVSGRSELDGGEWAEVRRDEAVLQFYTDPPHGTPDKPALSGTLYFYPDDVRSLANAWAGLVQFEWGPEEMPYGMREFAICDPNGYLLAFSEPVT